MNSSAWERENREWFKSDEFAVFCAEHYPPSEYVDRLLAQGKRQEAEDRYATEVRAGLMGLSIVEYQRRYPTERRRTMDKRRSIYFISTTERPRVGCHVKIGMASDPKARLSAIQTHHPRKLYLLGTVPGGRRVEIQLHERFREHRLEGEWFRMAPELKAYIQENAQ